MIRKRQLIFLRDVLVYTLSAFGGPQAHLALLLKNFVHKRNYVTEKELLEFNTLSQFLPGPSSTQTLAAIAYKQGGYRLAFLALLIWIMPSMLIMSFAAIGFSFFTIDGKVTHYLRYIAPVAVGFVGYSAIGLSRKIVDEAYMLGFVILSVIATVIFPSAYVFPVVILVGGFASALVLRKDDEQEQIALKVNWKKIIGPVLVLAVVGILGAIINRTSFISLPLRLFGNFYRNGFLIFGGGQVLIPLMYAEFVEMKRYITSQEFLSAWAFQQIVPGPVFSFTSFIGATSMRMYGVLGQLLGGFIAVIGINLPGVILLLFVLPIWEKFKKLNGIKRALPGINAVAVGFVVAAFLLMIQTLEHGLETSTIVLLTIVCMQYSKISPILLVVVAVVAGVLV